MAGNEQSQAREQATEQSQAREQSPAKEHSPAKSRAHMPEGTAKIINNRTLETGFPRLAELVAPGMRVLDVGCGSGAITRGIARRVQPSGYAVGVDVNERLIEEARRAHAGVPGLRFHLQDVYAMSFDKAFDLVTASRVLQWLAEPARALERMARAAVPGGRIAVLDYNHEKIEWRPEPPRSVRRFYDAFLKWREDAGMDNRIADRLPDIFERAGLKQVQVTEQHEVARLGDPDFHEKARIWADVAASRGHQLVADGYIAEAERAEAERALCAWVDEDATYQRLYLLAVEGATP